MGVAEAPAGRGQSISLEEVCHYLPHRFPFLMIDRAEEFIEGQSITGIKAVSANEPFFPGHFPGNPVMPGVLLIEAMGQSGALLSSKTLDLKPGQQTIMFLGVEKGKFRRPVVPGDYLRIPVKLLKIRRNIHFYEGEVRVNDAVCAQCTFSAMAVPSKA
ncbi:MAG: 3-hydroxyacyl-ACP dehydratase FabZ [Robiginitomaculum sp.]|nr:3-hydroxyacyl-ACP dehydratase FabZ [Robiginitomaculum sp.]MDQ7078475.1 3-hydroxyacyl-ACP dehydratase FabZ [Robiginitomaculum sp.]